jgi:hypothetical protein
MTLLLTPATNQAVEQPIQGGNEAGHSVVTMADQAPLPLLTAWASVPDVSPRVARRSASRGLRARTMAGPGVGERSGDPYYHVLPRLLRDDLLRDPWLAPANDTGAWWRLARLQR